MKDKGKWLVALTLLSAGIIIGSITRISPNTAESAAKPFKEIQPTYEKVDLGPAPTTAENSALNGGSEIKSLREKAEKGDAEAQCNLGAMYAYRAVAKDDKEAVKWYMMAAEQGNANAQFNLGNMYYFGLGIVQDYKEAVKWYAKAAEQGYAKAQNSLGLSYETGLGVVQDYKEAVKWYTKAIEQGLASAQFCLGEMYYKGQGVMQNYGEAARLYAKAAEQGNDLAQYRLSVMCAKGEGVSEDYVEGYKWLILAAAQGNAAAMLDKESVQKTLTESQVAEAQRLAREFKPIAEQTPVEQKHTDINKQEVENNEKEQEKARLTAKVKLQEKNANELSIRQERSELLREQDDRIRNLQQWLKNERQNIEKWYEDARRRIPEQRQNIENCYRDNLASLEQWKNAELERLKATERDATARFVQGQNNTISYTNVTSTTHGYISPSGDLNASTSSFGVSSTSVRGDPAKQFSNETAGLADSKIGIEKRYQEELRTLQNRRALYLKSISENSLQNEKMRAIQEAERYVENASNAAAAKKCNIATATEDKLAGGPGVTIDMIGGSEKTSFDCSINGRIYHKGNTLNGFTIQTISAREVIFEKDGKTFARRLQ